MDFAMSFIEVITMLLLLAGILYGFMYSLRHRARIRRWINNFESQDNAAEKADVIRHETRKMEDAQAKIDELNS